MNNLQVRVYFYLLLILMQNKFEIITNFLFLMDFITKVWIISGAFEVSLRLFKDFRFSQISVIDLFKFLSLLLISLSWELDFEL